MEDQLRSWELDGESVGIVEAALMVETGSWRRYDELWVVSCDPSTQLRRLCQRQQITPEEGRRWVNAQAPLRDKEALAHRLIWNDGDPEQLRHIVADLVRALR